VIACASAPREDVDESSVNALYSSLESAVSRYQDGLQALRGGDQDSARGLMASAAQDLVLLCPSLLCMQAQASLYLLLRWYQALAFPSR
jgi:hypothetical protein